MRHWIKQQDVASRWPHRRRRGFTLLEVVFALGLSLLLFGAILTAVNIYGQVSNAGRDDVEKSQLARTILRTIEIDVRSVMFSLPEEDEEEEPAADEAATEEETTADVLVETVDTAEVFSSESGGIFGDATTLVIHAGRPPGKLESLLLAEPPSDLKSIAYFLATPGGDGLAGAAGSLLDAEGNEKTQGLARLEGDRMTIEFADAAGDLQVLAAQTQLLAAEIDYLQFRYSDGQTWLDAWDSVAYERLPNAIEITLGINSQASGVPATSSTEIKTSRRYRFVVALPTAVPYVETTTDE